MSKGFKLVSFNEHSDDRGNLVALEVEQEIPFEVKRIYYIYGANNDCVRGKHAHKVLNQLIVCISGSVSFLLDNGKEKETIILNKPNTAIYIYSLVWREFSNFSKDCVIVVFASEHYDKSDYILDYNDFLEECNKNDSSFSRCQ